MPTPIGSSFRWHPRVEDLLWRPDLQEERLSESGQRNLRYRTPDKRRHLDRFHELPVRAMPYCGVRYAF